MKNKTKDKIMTGFNHLISHHSFDNITVAMICDQAGISRATFYRYFKDKYDVMNTNYIIVLNNAIDPHICHNFKEIYYNLFKTGQKELSFLKNAFETLGANSFHRFIHDYSYNIALEITKQNRNGLGFSERERLQMDLYCHGCSYMYEKWIDGDYSLNCQQAADAIYRMMPDSLKFHW